MRRAAVATGVADELRGFWQRHSQSLLIQAGGNQGDKDPTSSLFSSSLLQLPSIDWNQPKPRVLEPAGTLHWRPASWLGHREMEDRSGGKWKTCTTFAIYTLWPICFWTCLFILIIVRVIMKMIVTIYWVCTMLLVLSSISFNFHNMRWGLLCSQMQKLKLRVQGDWNHTISM